MRLAILKQRMLNNFLRGYRFVAYVANRFWHDGGTYRAAALTFTTLLSVVPLMSVSFTVLSAFPASKTLGKQINDFIFNHLVATSGEVVEKYLQTFVQQASQLSFIGTAFLLITAVLLIFTIEQAFNAIWRVKIRRKAVSAFLLYWAVLTLAPILIGISLAVSSYLTSLPIIYGTAQSIGITEALILKYSPFVMVTIVFTILYDAVPNCDVKIHHAFLGGLVAGVLFELAKWGFAFYIKLFPTYKLLYGALATVPIFFLWIYLSWTVILLGAEVAHACRAQYARRPGEKLDGFTQAYRWLGHLWSAQQEGKGLSIQELINRDPYNYDIEPDEQIDYLRAANLIQPSENGCYVLSRDLSSFTLWDLYRAMPWQLPAPEKIKVMQGRWEVTLEKTLSKVEALRHTDLNAPLADFYKLPKNSANNEEKAYQ